MVHLGASSVICDLSAPNKMAENCSWTEDFQNMCFVFNTTIFGQDCFKIIVFFTFCWISQVFVAFMKVIDVQTIMVLFL